MKKLALILAALTSVAAVQAQAQTVLTDSNGDGVYSYEELLLAFPQLTQDNFTAADKNANGTLDGDEIKMAQENGLIPA